MGNILRLDDGQTALTLGNLASTAAEKYGSREALVFKDRRFSYEEVAENVDLVARALIAQGIEAGDHVALWLNNCPEWVFVQYAVAKIGAVLIPVNTRFRTHDLEYLLRQSDTKLLITDNKSGPVDYLAMVKEVVNLPDPSQKVDDPNFPLLDRVIVFNQSGVGANSLWDDVMASAEQTTLSELQARVDAVQYDDLALILYTSGSTGFPKGVMHTHNILRNQIQRAGIMEITEEDVILNYLPLFHAFGFAEGSLMSLVAGARQILTETFDADESLDLIEQERVTMLGAFEAHTKDLMQAQLSRPRNISSLRVGCMPAGPLNIVPIVRKAADVLAPFKSMSGFGMTETWVGVSWGRLDDSIEQRSETSGVVTDGYAVRIVDFESQKLCEPGEQGEIQIHGYTVTKGYYKKEEETKKTFTEDGWLKTGDIGYWNHDGYLRFLGRAKDMLKVGGENVDPMEVEGFLLEVSKDIEQIAVVGCPHERLSEVPVAYIKMRENAVISEMDVISLCKNKMASFKIPKRVFFVDEFPMTASGKIRKLDLREDAERRFLAD